MFSKSLGLNPIFTLAAMSMESSLERVLNLRMEGKPRQRSAIPAAERARRRRRNEQARRSRRRNSR